MADVNVKPSDLPVEITTNILSRLPVKSLMRFRSVCKPWCRLFRNPAFIQKHLHLQALDSTTKVIVKHDAAAGEYCLSVLSSSSGDEMVAVVDTISIPLSINFCSNPFMLGPVNGLICLYASMGSIVLCNPATRQFKTIPSSKLKPLPGSIDAWPSNFGFGFDEKTKDYKIIKFVYNDFGGDELPKEQVELYSLKNDSWRQLPSLDVITHSIDSMFSPHINGVSYWWAGPPTAYVSPQPLVLSFDFADEVFEKLPLPLHFFAIQTEFAQLAIVNGLVSSVNYSYRGQGTCSETWVDVWSMTDHRIKESWKKVEVIGPIQGHHRPIGFCKNYLFCDNMRGQVFLYDRTAQQVYNLQLRGSTFSLQVAKYVESLVPVNGTRDDQSEGCTMFEACSALGTLCLDSI